MRGIIVIGLLIVFVVGCAGGNSAPGAAPVSGATSAPAATAPPSEVSLTGQGKKVSDPVPLKQGLVRFTMKNKGERNFIVKLMDREGKPAGGAMGTDSLLANQIGAWEGEKAIRIENTGEYVLDITSDAAWEITIRQ